MSPPPLPRACSTCPLYAWRRCIQPVRVCLTRGPRTDSCVWQGPALIIVNRTILKERGFNYPMAVSGLGLLFSSAVSLVLVHCRCVRNEHARVVTPSFWLQNLLPIGAALAATLAAGNAVYLYLPVGFIQMLKAFTPTVTLSMLWVTGIEVPSVRVLLAVLGICAGTAIASLGESSLNLIGLGLMLIAEVTEALRLVLTQKLLTNLKFGVRGRGRARPHAPRTHCARHRPRCALAAHPATHQAAVPAASTAASPAAVPLRRAAAAVRECSHARALSDLKSALAHATGGLG